MEPIIAESQWRGEGIDSHELDVPNQATVIGSRSEEAARKWKAKEIEEAPVDEDNDLAKAIRLNLSEDGEDCFTFEKIHVQENEAGRGTRSSKGQRTSSNGAALQPEDFFQRISRD